MPDDETTKTHQARTRSSLYRHGLIVLTYGMLMLALAHGFLSIVWLAPSVHSKVEVWWIWGAMRFFRPVAWALSLAIVGYGLMDRLLSDRLRPARMPKPVGATASFLVGLGALFTISSLFWGTAGWKLYFQGNVGTVGSAPLACAILPGLTLMGFIAGLAVRYWLRSEPWVAFLPPLCCLLFMPPLLEIIGTEYGLAWPTLCPSVRNTVIALAVLTTCCFFMGKLEKRSCGNRENTWDFVFVSLWALALWGQCTLIEGIKGDMCACGIGNYSPMLGENTAYAVLGAGAIACIIRYLVHRRQARARW